jgi:ribosomal protein S18 acetylase RimI-like enzyme
LHVRPACAEDAEGLQAVAWATGLAATAAQFREQVADPAIVLFVAEHDGAIIGFLAMRAVPAPECVPARAPLQMWRLYVAPPFHGQGVARTLTGRALVYAHASRHDVVWLGTAPDNARAIAFYSKCGFRNMGMANLHGEDSEHADRILACLLGIE